MTRRKSGHGYRGNDNAIVRVRNEEIHNLLEFVAEERNVPYQVVFEEWVESVVDGNNPTSPETLSKLVHLRILLASDK